MFSKKILFLSLVVVGVLATGCRKEPKKTKATPPSVSFNISGADALAGKEVSSGRNASGARAATVENSTLVKILENGTLESAVSAKVPDIEDLPKADKERMTKWGNLTDVFLPPKGSNCSDVYLLFDDETTFPAQDPEKEGVITYWSLSNLLCIHSDNSYTDILNDSPWQDIIYTIDNKKNIQIASDGSLFVLFRDGGGWEYFIKKYDPSTKKVNEVCRFGRAYPLVEETVGWTSEDWASNRVYVNRMIISKDGKYAYIQIRKDNQYYLHVVSTENPANSKDLTLSGQGYWDYDEKGNKLYYLAEKEVSGQTHDIVYSADYTGNNSAEFSDLGTSSYCEALMVIGNDVWMRSGRAGYSDDPNTYVVFQNVKDESTRFEVPVKYSLYCGSDYIVKDNFIYLCCSNDQDYSYTGYVYKENEIIRADVTNRNAIQYKNKLSEKENIKIFTWNVGDSKLYIAGESNGKPANYALNLNGTGNAQKIAEGQVFTCIGSLK